MTAFYLDRSIHYDLTELEIVALFSAFGTVVKCEMSKDAGTRKTKGYCFLEFATKESADAAMTMDGFELAGRKVTQYFTIFDVISLF